MQGDTSFALRHPSLRAGYQSRAHAAHRGVAAEARSSAGAEPVGGEQWQWGERSRRRWSCRRRRGVARRGICKESGQEGIKSGGGSSGRVVGGEGTAAVVEWRWGFGRRGGASARRRPGGVGSDSSRRKRGRRQRGLEAAARVWWLGLRTGARNRPLRPRAAARHGCRYRSARPVGGHRLGRVGCLVGAARVPSQRGGVCRQWRLLPLMGDRLAGSRLPPTSCWLLRLAGVLLPLAARLGSSSEGLSAASAGGVGEPTTAAAEEERAALAPLALPCHGGGATGNKKMVLDVGAARGAAAAAAESPCPLARRPPQRLLHDDAAA